MRFRDYSGSSLAPRALTHARRLALSHTHEACTRTHCHSTSLWGLAGKRVPKERTLRGLRAGPLSSRPLAAGRSRGKLTRVPEHP